MLFNSLNYLIFFPIVILFYFAIPAKYKEIRNFWLLVASYFFYMNWNAAYALLLFGSTFVTYLAGILIEKAIEKENISFAKWILGISFTINIGILFFYKYINFFILNINRILGLRGSNEIGLLDILLPVGISFYIFQALGYTMDVYRQKTKATKNLFRYMLFVSFFPQLVAGPIERSTNLLKQFDEEHVFDTDRVREGLLTMLWGLFMKIMIADNLAVYIDSVYENYPAYTGIEIVLATMMFAFQIYCDFGGYTYLAIGSAKVLGFTLMENFNAPYQATSVKDFWRRWHISLTGWFTDYLYIPLGGNRKGKIRKYINTFIVFFVSGLWHGASWSYVVWGVINGIYLIIQDVTVAVRQKVKQYLHVREDRFSYRFGCGVVTFFLVDFSWLFFRAKSLGIAVDMLKQIVLSLQPAKIFGLAVNRMGYSMQQLVALIFAMLLLFAFDILKNHMYLMSKMDVQNRSGSRARHAGQKQIGDGQSGQVQGESNIGHAEQNRTERDSVQTGRPANVFQIILSQGMWFRWLVYLGLLFMILVYGAYGLEYTQTEFIYFQF